MDDWAEEVIVRGDGSPDDQVGELRIKIRELPMADGVHASTGCQLCHAAQVLAWELLRRPQLIAGKQVVEVGAGCGLTGITAARLARRTLITDGDEEAVKNLEYNLKANEGCWKTAGNEACARRLRWEDVLESSWPSEERAEVIIAADIIYGQWGDVVGRAFLKMLAPGGLILLVASEDWRSSVNGFKNHLSSSGFRLVETRLKVPLGDFLLFECRERLPSDPGGPAVVTVEREEFEPPAVDVAVLGRRVLPSASGAGGLEQSPRVSQQRGGVPPRGVGDSGDGLPLLSPGTPSGLLGAAQSAGGGRGGLLGAGATPHLASVAGPKDFAARAGMVPGGASRVWRVVGGSSYGGIIVRSGCQIARPVKRLGRLAHGALVEEVERVDSRLRYSKLRGDGPSQGWVSILSADGVELLAKESSWSPGVAA